MKAAPQRLPLWAPLLIAVGLALSSIRGAAVTFPLSWRWSNPLPHGNNIIDVAYRDQFWIQVAERGQIYTSDDLVTWATRESHTSRALRSVTFFQDRIVIVGENGTVLSGLSASDLSLIDLGTPDWLEAVAASSQLAVAVGDNGAIYISNDGRNWSRQNQTFQDWLRSITFGTPGGVGTFVAVGEGGFIATSTNGIKWQARNRITSEDLNRVAWFSGEFWALGNAGVVLQSGSGANWVSINTGATNILNAFAGLDALRIIAGDAEVRLRAGRGPWKNELLASNPLPPPLWTYLSAASDTNSILLCGRTGMMVEGQLATNNVMFWSPLSDSPRHWLWDVKRFPKLFLATGDRATILSSANGTGWQQELPPDSATNSILLGIGGRTNLAVAVGSAGTIITSVESQQPLVGSNPDGSVVTNQASTLGIFWNAVEPRPTTNDLQGITVFGDRFVATGGLGTILTSPDAQVWTRQNSPTFAFLSSVETFPGGIVAVGRSGTILTSPDTVTWTIRSSGSPNWIYRVRYLGGRLIAVGQNGTILTSADGVQWDAQTSGTGHWLNDVQWIDNTYFVIGALGTVLSSPDAINWTDRGTITGKSLFGAAVRAGMLVIVGVEGTILRSQVVPSDTPVQFVRFPKQPNEREFVLSGQAGQRFTLDRSTNLNSWSAGPLLEIDHSGTLQHVDGGPNSTSQQFFRTTVK